MILIGDFADLVRFEEDHLGDAFIGVNLGRQRRRIGELQGHVAFPFRFERRHIDHDAAAPIGRFSQADGQHIEWNAEIFHGMRQGERVGWNDAHLAFEIDEGIRIEVLRIDDRAVDVGEQLEFVRAANDLAVTRSAVRHHAPAMRRIHRSDSMPMGLPQASAPWLSRHAG